jgi:hypothetical protein
VAAREAAQRAEEERRAKEAAAAREAAQHADEERHAKEAAAAREAQQRVENERRAEAACKRDQSRLDDLRTAGNSESVRADLKQLSIDLTCERLRSQVVALLEKVRSEPEKSGAPSPPANTPELIASAQRELTRIGCYSGASNGKVDDATKEAIKTYQERKRVPVGDLEVTDGFVKELSKQRLRVCPTEVAEPSKHRRERAKDEQAESKKSKQAKDEQAESKKSKQAKDERAESKKSRQARNERESTRSRAEFRTQAVPQVRQEAGRAHPMIGVGF